MKWFNITVHLLGKLDVIKTHMLINYFKMSQIENSLRTIHNLKMHVSLNKRFVLTKLLKMQRKPNYKNIKLTVTKYNTSILI